MTRPFRIFEFCKISKSAKTKVTRPNFKGFHFLSLETHSDISQKCPMCGKLSRNLKRHLFVVHKQCYPCPECSRSFQAELGLEAHRRKEHGIGLFIKQSEI